MAWIVGTTTDLTWQTGSSTVPPPTFQVLEATTYQPGTNCTLQVLGADNTFWIVWSPTSNPEDPNAVQLAIVSTDLDANGDGNVVVTAQRGFVRYGELGWIYLFQNGESGGLTKTLTAEAGKQYVTLQAPLLDPSLRLSSTPVDLAATDQVIWWNPQPSGTVTVYDNGAFTASATVQSFQAEVHVLGEGYSDPATILIGALPVSRWTSSAIRSHTGTLLANQTGISYVILPSHNVYAVSPIAMADTGATDGLGRFNITDLSYPAAEPVTVILRWLEGGTIDRFIVVYTQLVEQV